MSKTCNQCNTEKILELFSPSPKGKFGRRAKCKSCEAEIAKARRLQNPQASRDAVEKYRLANPDVIARRDAKYYQKYKERLNKKTKEWRNNNPEKYAELNRRKEHRRRARKFENGSEPYTEKQIIETYGLLCNICKEGINFAAPRKVGLRGWERGFHIDHVVPLSKGGSDTLENVRPTHGKCNLGKSNFVL